MDSTVRWPQLESFLGGHKSLYLEVKQLNNKINIYIYIYISSSFKSEFGEGVVLDTRKISSHWMHLWSM